jgi:hypothetical protein
MSKRAGQLALIVWGITLIPALAAEVSFNRDVRPILARKCFACHGPDEHSREADLRLDLFAEATRSDRTVPAIVPGKPDQSEALRRITSTDPDSRMPPAPQHPPLSPREVEILAEWISAGAVYEQHWSFVPPERPVVPAGAAHPIDAFVLAELARHGLNPAPTADWNTRIRRVSLDLIGLIPTPEELEQTERERLQLGEEAAYRAYVERLLASPYYGERWGRWWLDLARYADTNGYEKDREREIWAYRDWVIKALNEDLPFDQFTIRQLAGDLLPGAGIEERIATGFHRNTMLNEEGGIDPLEFRFYAMVDRVATTGTTWLGLTLGCVQCHTHKYDPLQHEEFYSLMALLNQADEVDLELPDAGRQAAEQERHTRADRLLSALPDQWPVPAAVQRAPRELARERFQEWLLQQRSEVIQWQTLEPLRAEANLPRLSVLEDQSILAAGDTSKQDHYRVTYRAPGKVVTAIRLEALPHPSLPARGPGMTYYEGTKGDFFLGELQLESQGVPLKLTHATESYQGNRFGKQPVTAALTIDGDLQTGWAVHGRQGERHSAVYELAEPVQIDSDLILQMTFGRHFSSSLGRFRLSFTTEKQPPQARDISAEVEALLRTPADQLTAEQEQRLFEEFLLTAAELAEPAKAIRELRKPLPVATTLIFQERPADHQRPTFRHARGEYLRPEELVQPGTPAILHPWPENLSKNRLGLARWLMAPENPLTARVLANRIWAAYFGRGLVETVEDLGTQGASPSHPELLDWLAIELREQKWSLKQLHRLIVTSQTYQQSSRLTPEQLAADPQNIWLARAPRLRLEAEVLRDSLLRAAGLLSDRRGGPGVRPPQPPGVTEAAYGSPSWQPSEGADRYRRSIYTFIKRTAPFAMYGTFDAPSGEACTARRERSNTPLQALTLLNDVMLQEAAQALGRVLVESPGTFDGKLDVAYRRVLSRLPDDAERSIWQDFVDELSSSRDEAVTQMAETERELALWTAVCRSLFALDEAIVRN